MTEAAGPTWFCIKAKPRQEAVAVQNLRAVGIDELVFPRLRRTRRGHDKNKVVVEPLFPGYVFARFDPMEFQSTIRSTRGVLHLVSREGRPVDVEQAVIDELNALLAARFREKTTAAWLDELEPKGVFCAKVKFTGCPSSAHSIWWWFCVWHRCGCLISRCCSWRLRLCACFCWLWDG